MIEQYIPTAHPHLIRLCDGCKHPLHVHSNDSGCLAHTYDDEDKRYCKCTSGCPSDLESLATDWSDGEWSYSG